MKKRYTIIALSENCPGVLHRLTSVFTRRRINIESLTVSETEREGISRFTVTFFATPDWVEKLVKPIRRIVEVTAAYASVDEELLFKEIAFVRVGFDSATMKSEIEQAADDHAARVVMTNGKTLVLEKTGKEEEINEFLQDFKKFDVHTFIRSGRIAIERVEGDLHLFEEELRNPG